MPGVGVCSDERINSMNWKMFLLRKPLVCKMINVTNVNKLESLCVKGKLIIPSFTP